MVGCQRQLNAVQCSQTMKLMCKQQAYVLSEVNPFPREGETLGMENREC